MRRRTLLVALAGLVVVVAACVVVLSPTQPNRITQENCDRIKVRMSRAEVEAILGPPGDYRTRLGESKRKFDQSWNPDPADYGSVATWRSFDDHGNPLAPVSVGIWISDSIRIDVYILDPSGRVMRTETQARRSAGTLDNLLWRAERQWHRWFPE